MNTLYINEEIFKTKVLVIWDCNIAKANRYLKRKKAKYYITDTGNDGALIKANNGLYRIAWVRKIKFKDNGVLVHELFHLITRIMNDKGVPIIPNIQTGEVGDETAAYLLEYYYNAVMRKIK